MASSSTNQSTSQCSTTTKAALNSIPSLREITSMTLAIELWRTGLRQEFQVVFESGKISEDKLQKTINKLPPLTEMIRKSMAWDLKRFGNCLLYWAKYCKKHIFGGDLPCLSSAPISELVLMRTVWQPNGLINERKSVLNMLSEEPRSVVDMFKIASKFCMEDEIKKLSLASIPVKFVQSLNIKTHPLMFYWLHYMKGDLSKVPTASVMILKPKVVTWSAIEYFWDRLSVTEKTKLIPKLFDDEDEKRKYHTFKLLLKMNDDEKRRAFEASWCQIIRHVWEYESYNPVAREIFTSMVTVVNAQHFYVLFLQIFQVGFYEHQGDMKPVLEVWDTLPENLKEKIRKNGHILGYYFQFDRKCDRRFVSKHKVSFDFLWTVLRSSSPELRKTTIMRHAHDPMLLYAPFSIIDQLFRLCLPKAEDMADFRKKFANSEIVAYNVADCMSIDYFGDEKDLIKFIARYFPTEKDIAMFRKAYNKHCDEVYMRDAFDAALKAVQNGEVEPFVV